MAPGAVGLVPVIVDIDPATLNIDPAQIERAIGPKTRGIMIVPSTAILAPWMLSSISASVAH